MLVNAGYRFTELFCVALLASCYTFTFAQTPRKLPNPTDAISDQNPSTQFPTSSDFNNLSKIPSPGISRAMAERAVSDLDGITIRIQQNQQSIQNCRAQIAKLDEDIDQMRREKQEVLSELRGGFFCSQCKRSKTEIERGGENFEQHLIHVNGVKIAAPASLVNAKAEEYDQKIADLVARARTGMLRLENEIRRYEDENKFAWGQIQQNIDLWRLAVSLEQSLMVAREKKTRELELDEIKVATQKIKVLETGDRIGSPEAADSLNSEIAMWKKIKAQAEENASKRFSSYWQDINNSNKVRNSEYTRISGFLPRTSEYAKHMLVKYEAYGSLPPLRISTERLTGIPLSLKFDKGMLGMSLDTKVGNMTVEGGPTSPATTEARAFLRLASNLIGLPDFKVGVSWVTDYTLDGPTSYPVPIFEMKAITSLPRPEDKPKRTLPKP
jgi:hypothetical protein